MSRRIVILGVLLVLLLVLGWWRGSVIEAPRADTPPPETAALTGADRVPPDEAADSGTVVPSAADHAEDRPELVEVEVLVVDESGSPRAGIEVRVLDRGFAHRDWERPEEMILARAETDEAGRATLMVPADPEVRLHAFGAGAAASTKHFQAKQIQRHELRLVRTATVGGRVEAHDGEPIEGAVVVGFFETRGGFLSAFVNTDRDGRFEFADVPPEDLVRDYLYFHARKEGYWRTGDRRCNAAEARDGGVVLRIRRRTSLTGRCVSPEGEPIGRARLRVEIEEPWHESSATTGPDGRFTLYTVPGPGRIQAVAPGFAPSPPREIRADLHPTDIGDLVLRRGGAVRGRVTGQDGEPLPGAEVSLGSRDTMHHTDRVTTGPGGRFEFLHVGEGDHDLSAVGPRGERPGLRPLQTVVTEVRTGAAPLEVRLTGARYIQVRLVPDGGGAPLTAKEVTIEYLREGCRPLSRTFRDWKSGQADRAGPMGEAGPLRVMVMIEGYAPTVVDAVTRDDREVIVEVPMRRE